jgi:hypothetical protein
VEEMLVCCEEVIGSSSGVFVKHRNVQTCFMAKAMLGFLVCAHAAEENWHSTTFAGKQVLC